MRLLSVSGWDWGRFAFLSFHDGFEEALLFVDAGLSVWKLAGLI